MQIAAAFPLGAEQTLIILRGAKGCLQRVQPPCAPSVPTLGPAESRTIFHCRSEVPGVSRDIVASRVRLQQGPQPPAPRGPPNYLSIFPLLSLLDLLWKPPLPSHMALPWHPEIAATRALRTMTRHWSGIHGPPWTCDGRCFVAAEPDSLKPSSDEFRCGGLVERLGRRRGMMH